MHPNNPHKDRYNFPELIKASPALKAFVIKNKYGDESINFDDPDSVRELNRAILHHFYGIKHWEIPPQFLCPPIPGRVDYIHHLADLFQLKKPLKGLDIGVGANCIYPLIGYKAYGWTFVGSDIESEALKSASKILKLNDLDSVIELRLQSSKKNIFKSIIKEKEHFDFSMCNPPFHSSQEEALAGTHRKRKNLGLAGNDKLNFGGKSSELWCEGGEREFITQMINESAQFSESVTWFTSLVSKESNLPFLQKSLRNVDCQNSKIIEMSQGQKKSRILAWSYGQKD